MTRSPKLILIAAALLIAIVMYIASCSKTSVQQPQYDQPTTVSISVDGDVSETIRIK